MKGECTMRAMEELREMLMAELEKLTRKGDVNNVGLEQIDKLTHSIKSIDTIMAMEDSGYSHRRAYSYGGRRMGDYDYSYGDYENRGGMYGNTGYGYHDEKSAMVSKLEKMMADAPNDKIREAIRKAINQIEEQ